MTKRDHAGVLIPPPLLYLIPIAIAMLLHSRRPWPIADAWLALTLWGAVVFATGVAIGATSVFNFRKANTTILPMGRPTTAIVAHGPYRFTRNPMYLGMACGYLGISLMLNNLWALLFMPLAVAVIDWFVIRREERYLAGKFGEPYREYCSRVRRWI